MAHFAGGLMADLVPGTTGHCEQCAIGLEEIGMGRSVVEFSTELDGYVFE